MNLEEYQQQQQQISQQVAQSVLGVVQTFLSPALTADRWVELLRALFPLVEAARERSARLARSFYDDERAAHFPDASRLDEPITSYRFSWFEEAMHPVRKRFIQSDTGQGAAAEAVMRTTKEVENGGRRQLLSMTSSDAQVKGWARVATGRETCAFCLMLVSRGAVYFSAEDAGMDLDDEDAVELWRRGDDAAMDEMMKRWHPNCDCKIVPVFDRKNWPGRDAYLRAEQRWIEATRGYRGKDALNAFRRAVENGDVPVGDFAAVA